MEAINETSVVWSSPRRSGLSWHIFDLECRSDSAAPGSCGNRQRASDPRAILAVASLGPRVSSLLARPVRPAALPALVNWTRGGRQGASAPRHLFWGRARGLAPRTRPLNSGQCVILGFASPPKSGGQRRACRIAGPRTAKSHSAYSLRSFGSGGFCISAELRRSSTSTMVPNRSNKNRAARSAG